MTRSVVVSAPRLQPSPTREPTPERATPEQQAALGLFDTLRDDWREAAVRRMGEQVAGSRSLRMAMDTCMRCGACTDKCHFFLGDGTGADGGGDPNNMPVARQELYRKVYRRYFTFAGRWLPGLVGAEDLTEEVLEDWYRYFHQCTQCRRCTEFCPSGIDTAEISMAARDILNHVGVGQRYSNEVVVTALARGNNLGLPHPVIEDTLETLAEDVEEETGVAVPFPLDAVDAEVLLVVPSADLFAEPHVDGLIGAAKVLHAAGVSWTLSSSASEAANFALFTGDEANRRKMLSRIVVAARELRVRRIVFGECGHAWRVAYAELPAMCGALDLDPAHRAPEHIVEVTHALFEAGRIQLDKTANEHRRVTFHDSCNIARAASMGGREGGQFELPRELLRAACAHVVEMAPETTRERTFCCGAGAGLLGEDILAQRRRGAAPRLAAFDAVAASDGVTDIVAICAICKTQLTRMLSERPNARVASLHQIVGDAVVL